MASEKIGSIAFLGNVLDSSNNTASTEAENIYKVSARLETTINSIIKELPKTEPVLFNSMAYYVCSQLETAIAEQHITSIEILYGYLHNAFSRGKECAQNAQDLIAQGVLEETCYYRYRDACYTYASVAHIAAAHNDPHLLRILLFNGSTHLPANFDLNGIEEIIQDNLTHNTGTAQNAAIECAKIIVDYKDNNAGQSLNPLQLKSYIQDIVDPQAQSASAFLYKCAYYWRVTTTVLSKIFNRREFAVRQQINARVQSKTGGLTVHDLDDYFALAVKRISKRHLSLNSILLRRLRRAHRTLVSQRRLPQLRLLVK